MRSINVVSLVPAIEKRVNKLSHGAKNCPQVICARALWPDKTAENWAAAAGKKASIGKNWLRGELSGDAKNVLARLMLA